MVEAGDHGELDDIPVVRRLHLPWFRGVLLQRQVRSATVIVSEIISKNPAQVTVVEDDQMIDAVSTQCSDGELVAIDAVAVTEKISWRCIPGKGSVKICSHFLLGAALDLPPVLPPRRGVP